MYLIRTIANLFLLYFIIRSSNYGDRSVNGIIKVMQTKKMLYLEAGGLVEFEEDPLCICIVTPLMRRAHGMPFSKDIVFVDSSSFVIRVVHV